MKYKDLTFPKTTFEEFLEKNNLEIVVHERGGARFPNFRYYADIEDVEIKVDDALASASKNGDTPDDAIEALAIYLLGKTLIVDAYGPRRREIQVPNEWVKA